MKHRNLTKARASRVLWVALLVAFLPFGVYAAEQQEPRKKLQVGVILQDQNDSAKALRGAWALAVYDTTTTPMPSRLLLEEDNRDQIFMVEAAADPQGDAGLRIFSRMEPGRRDGESEFVFWFPPDQLGEIRNLYILAGADGYHPAMRKLWLNYKSQAKTLALSGPGVTRHFRGVLALAGTGTVELGDKARVIALSGDVEVDVPEGACPSGNRVYVDPIKGGAVPNGFDPAFGIETNGIAITPYDIVLDKPVRLRFKPVRELIRPGGAKAVMAVAPVRVDPQTWQREQIQEEPATIKNGLAECQVSRGGIYYCVLWSPRDEEPSKREGSPTVF